jgi:hypothetical protein
MNSSAEHPFALSPSTSLRTGLLKDRAYQPFALSLSKGPKAERVTP